VPHVTELGDALDSEPSTPDSSGYDAIDEGEL
jgi:hypothetical protein